MTRGRRLGATLLASALLALSAPFTAAAATPRAAQPIGEPVPPAGGAQALELEITSLTPRVATADTPSVTVKGKVTNTGDRRVDGIRARFQRGDAISSDKELRDIESLKTDAVDGAFHDVSKVLEPGDSANLDITIPLTGDRGTLRITEPGVYPLLVNVNGRPDYGEQARLAAVSIALPVISVPGGGEAEPKTAPPGVTLLWPLLDEHPRRLPAVDGKTRLADDELAESLAVGGRLFNLVSTVHTVAATNTELVRSMCFAVDPDLLETVSAMAEGYQVRTASGQYVAGKGAEAATNWLQQVRDLTRGHCVLSVPYADADLVSLTRAGAVDLARLSLTGSTAVSELLSVQPLKEVYWPAGGTYDPQTLIDMSNAATTTILADPGRLENVEGSAPYRLNSVQAANPARALPIDSLVSEALAGPATEGLTVAGATSDTNVSVQTGLAALAYRGAFDQRAGGQVLVAPPRRWLASNTELTEFLTLTRELFDQGFTTPMPLNQAVSAPEGGTAGQISFTPHDSTQGIPTQVTAEVMRINATRRDMFDAMANDNTNGATPDGLLSPIQYGLLRGVSTAWRGRPQSAIDTVNFVDAQLDGLRKLVVVKDSGRPLSLASGDAPIPFSIYNGLPVTIVVRVSLSPVPGLRAEPIQDVRVPPLGSVPRYIQADVSRSGRFSVNVELSTPGGTSLGEPVRLELNSTSYGIISVAVTGAAGVVLVLLASFRIFRRIRAARAGEAKTGEEIVES